MLDIYRYICRDQTSDHLSTTAGTKTQCQTITLMIQSGLINTLYSLLQTKTHRRVGFALAAEEVEPGTDPVTDPCCVSTVRPV